MSENLSALARLALRPIGSEADFLQAVRLVTEAAAETLAAERVSVWLLDEDGVVIRCIDRYLRSSGDHQAGDRMPFERRAGYLDELEVGNVVTVDDVRADPRVAEILDEFLLPFGVGALLDALIWSERRFKGSLVVSHVGSTRRWTEQDVYFARAAADIVSLHHAELSRRRALAAMETSERQYRDLAQLNPDAVIVQVGGRIAFANSRACQMFGADAPDVLVGMNSLDIVDPAFRDLVLARRNRVIDTDAPASQLETRHRRLDGSVFPTEMTSGPINWAGDEGTVNIVRDISERKAAERSLQRSDQLLRATILNSPISVAIKSLDGTYLYVSEVFAAARGMTVDQIVGKSAADIFPADLAAQFGREDRELFETKEPISYEFDSPTAEGGLRRLYLVRFPVLDTDGAPFATGSFALDLSEIREAEAALRQLQRLDSLGQLSGGIAHDFNNILAVIMGNAELLEGRMADPADADYLDRIIETAERGAALTGRLLAFARNQPLQTAPVAIDPLLQKLADLLRHTLGKTITIDVATAPDVGPALTDAGLLESALLNLALNARDAMPEGGALKIDARNVVVDVALAERLGDVPPGDFVAIAVSDTGPGAPPEVVANVFEPFFTTKPPGKGHGLGLSMIYGFAKQSGGHATFESPPGEGATVRLYLPRAKDAGARDVGGPARAAGGGERILVVEDEPEVRRIAEGILRARGYHATGASDGAEALKAFAEAGPFDLLFTDVVLPGGMSGVTLAARIQELRPETVVLYASGHAADSTLRDTLQATGAKFLQKPYRLEELLAAVRESIEVRPRRRG